MAKTQQAKDVKLKAIAGTDYGVLATWKCSAAHLDHYGVMWEYNPNASGGTWIKASANYASTGKNKQSTYNAPSNARRVRATVLPYAKKDKKGKAYWGGKKATSAEFDCGNLGAAAKAAAAATAAAAAATEEERKKKEAEAAAAAMREENRRLGDVQWGAAIANRNSAAAEEAAALKAPRLADKSAHRTKAVKLYGVAKAQYESASSYYDKGGYSGKKKSADKGASACGDSISTLNGYIAAGGSNRELKEYFSSLAASERNAANGDVRAAANRRKSKDYGNSARYEGGAAVRFDNAARYYGLAKGYEQNAVAKEAIERLETSMKGYASSASSRKAGDEKAYADSIALAKEKAATPAAPTDCKASRSGERFSVSCKVAAKWARYVQFQVLDSGKWRGWSGSTVAKATGNASAVTSRVTFKGVVGRRYRFRARALLADKKKASGWAVSDYCSTRPAQPRNLRVSSVSRGAMKIEWDNVGQGVESLDVEYSTYRNPKTGKTAWADGATAEVKRVSLPAGTKVHTLTGLADGVRVYARVRAANAAGSAYATAKGSKSTTVSGTPPKPVVKLAALTGLKATLLPDNRTVKLVFSGAVEAGASVKVEHTSKSGAFSNNIADAITSEAYDPPSASAKSHAFSLGSLDQGKTHWFRVVKEKGGKSVRAKCASGGWRSSDYVAKVAVPAERSASVTAPSALSLSSPYEGAVRAEWSDRCKSGEAYELQCTSNASAFEDNAYGDIVATSYDDPPVGARAHVYTLTGLEAGATYWARVRKVAGGAASGWSAVAEVTLDPPSASEEGLLAPQVAAMLPAYPSDAAPVLSWLHQAEQEGSAQTAYEVALSAAPPEPTARYERAVDEEVDGAKTYYVADGGSWSEVAEPQDDQLGEYYVLVVDPAGTPVESTLSGGADNAVALDLSGYADGSEVTWMVRTQGAVAGAWSPWSAAQAFAVVEPPVAGVALADADGAGVDDAAPLSKLPLAATVSLAGMDSNPPVELHLAVRAADGYETTADDGSDAYVAAGETVFSRYYTADDGLAAGSFEAIIPASDIRLDTGRSYVARAAVATALGLRAESPDLGFSVEWGDGLPAPDAEAEYDEDEMVVRIAPACYSAEAGEADADEGQSPGMESFAIGLASLPAAVQLPPGSVYVEGVSASVVEDGEVVEVPCEWEWDGEARTVTVSSVSYLGDAGEAALAVSYVGMEAAEPGPDDGPDGEPEPDGDPEGVAPSEPLATADLDNIGSGGAVEADEAGGALADYSADSEGEPEADAASLVDGVTLDVYRLAFDGQAVAIATGLPNDGQASCTDPHPPFGTAAYRVVAHAASTDEQSVAEVVVDTPSDRVVVTTPWGDVAMPYGLSLEESHASDSEAVAFSGRRKKVAFFGPGVETTVSQSAKVLAELSNGEVASLRRLTHAGTLAYLRDPTGLAFWAIVRVRMSHAGRRSTEVSLDYEMVDAPEGEVD